MDRRRVVYYNQRTTRLAPQRKKHSQLTARKILLATSVIVFAIIGQFLISSPTTENPTKVLADKTEVSIQEPYIDSPLQNVVLPSIGQSAIGTLEQGLIKHTENEVQAPIASITKVITALVILDKSSLQIGEKGDVITLTDKDAQYFNDYFAKLGTVTAVTVGESMTQYEALQAILLPSSNNMADSLIDRYFSSLDEYLLYANEFLQKNGLENTIVADASGYSPGSKSTPSDLIKLGQLALNNPVIKEIVAQKSATIAVAGDIPNYNQLINEPDVIGIKPGTTDEAGYCLLFAANLTDSSGKVHTIIGATIGHPDRPAYIESINQLLESSRQTILTSND